MLPRRRARCFSKAVASTLRSVEGSCRADLPLRSEIDRRRLLAGFETEYDEEKWEKAYRQGRAQWGSPSKHGRCGAGL